MGVTKRSRKQPSDKAELKKGKQQLSHQSRSCESGDGANVTFDVALQTLESILDNPDEFAAPSPDLKKSLTQILKTVFDHSRRTQPLKLGPLQELFVEDFDTETIWEQLQLRNPAVQRFVSKVTKRLLQKVDDINVDDSEEENDSAGVEEENYGNPASESDSSTEQESEEEADECVENEEEDDESLDEDEEEEEEEEEEEDEEDDEQNDEESSKGSIKQNRFQEDKARINDKFFDWDEMERFADEEEEREMRDSSDEEEEDDNEEEEEDEENWSGSEEKEIRYEDFFGDERAEEDNAEDQELHDEDVTFQKPKDVRKEQEEDEDVSNMTSFQKLQLEKRKEIESLEEELISERPWELRGEVRAVDRPENSLLEAVLDVERQTRPEMPVPLEKTASIEEMIKSRILQERWDDVVAKDSGEGALMNRRRSTEEELPEVSQEKSKEGLGEIYEKEYMRLAMGIEGDSPESKEKLEMAALFRKLCMKLDALSNFHFTPKTPIVDELAVKPNVPAITMEEVLPLAVSAAQMQAPEEVHEKKRGREGVLRDTKELEQAERQRLRRSKKAARRKARQQAAATEKLLARINPGLGNKYSGEKLRAEIRESGKVVGGRLEAGNQKRMYTTSSKFFSALQDEITTHGGYAKKPAVKQQQQQGKTGGKQAGAAALKL